jgi:membrane protease YdiL (CAAX protease family)
MKRPMESSRTGREVYYLILGAAMKQLNSDEVRLAAHDERAASNDGAKLTEIGAVLDQSSAQAAHNVIDENGQASHNLWFAVAAVLSIAWFPYVAVCVLYEFYTDDSGVWPFAAEHLWEMVQHLSIVAVILYIMYRDGRPWSAFGIVRPRLVHDIGLALLVFFGASMALGTIYSFGAVVVGHDEMDSLSTSDYAFSVPITAADFIVLILVSLTIGLSEEIAMRGYLLPTLERLLGSTAMSVVVTSLLFASYHLYQGVGATVWILLIGLVFGCAFCWMRRLWPLVLAHAAMDIWALWPVE